MTAITTGVQNRIDVALRFGDDSEYELQYADLALIVKGLGSTFALIFALHELEGTKNPPRYNTFDELLEDHQWDVDSKIRVESFRYNSPLDLLVSLPTSWAGIVAFTLGGLYAVQDLWKRSQQSRGVKVRKDLEVRLLKQLRTKFLQLEQLSVEDASKELRGLETKLKDEIASIVSFLEMVDGLEIKPPVEQTD